MRGGHTGVQDMLQSTYGFDPGAITLLHNQNATLAKVRAGLDALFAGAHAGDQLVYFESSHGYQYPEGDTMVEVLCLYDGFLTDTEFVGRTQNLPPNVLTAVLDCCHSGGLNKVFFVDDWYKWPGRKSGNPALRNQLGTFSCTPR